MIASVVSLIAVVIGFTVLVVYVYRPSQRHRWRQKGIDALDLPVDDIDLDAHVRGDRSE